MRDAIKASEIAVDKSVVDSRYAGQHQSYDLAHMFKALGDPTRLRIFEFLRECSCPVAVNDVGDVRATTGPTVGEVCCNVTGEPTITSTVSFHLKELRLARLVTVQRRGKYQICGINRDAMAALIGFFGETVLPMSVEAKQSTQLGENNA